MRIATSLSAALFVAFAAEGQVRTIAVTGEALPNTGGRIIENLSAFRLNDAGQVAFFGDGQDSDALYRVDPDGSAHVIAAAGDVAPGTNGGVFLNSGFDDISMNNLGQVAFVSYVIGHPPGSVWISGVDGSLGSPAYTSDRNFIGSRLDDSGSLGALAARDGTWWVQYIQESGSTERSGNTILGETFANNGYAAYSAIVSAASSQRAIYRLHNGTSQITVAREDRQNSAGITFTNIGSVSNAVNSNGVVTFSASYTDADGIAGNGIWAGGNGFQPPELLVERGRLLPGRTDASLTFFGETRLPADDAAYFYSQYETDSGEQGRGLFSIGIGTDTLTELVTTDTALPGRPDAAIQWITDWNVNSHGSVIFQSLLSVDGDDDQLKAIYGIHGPTGLLSELYVIGDLLEVAPGDLREIVDLEIAGQSSDGNRDVDLRTAVLNESDEFLFRAEFADGSSGLFVAEIPAPSVASLMAVAGIASLGRRRRR